MTKGQISGYSYRVIQAKKSELIVIMYEVCITYLQDASKNLQNNELQEFHNNIKSAQRVVHQLMKALDMQYKVSVDLMSLYRYLNKMLIQASARKDNAGVEAVIRLLFKLETTFKKVSEQDTSEPLMKNTQHIYAGLTYGYGGLNEYEHQTTKRGYVV